jgi:hypothetical protein
MTTRRSPKGGDALWRACPMGFQHCAEFDQVRSCLNLRQATGPTNGRPKSESRCGNVIRIRRTYEIKILISVICLEYSPECGVIIETYAILNQILTNPAAFSHRELFSGVTVAVRMISKRGFQ